MLLQLHALAVDVLGPHLGAVAEGGLDALLAVDDRRLGDVAVLDRRDDLGGVDVLGRPDVAEQAAGEDHQQDGQGDPDDRTAENSPDVHERGTSRPRPS
ncbi:MAG: hypothetical protein U0S36_06885 [Candidatus Nanopelagicales bacterium]